MAALARTFSRSLQVETATTRADSIERLRQGHFDLIIACETLHEGSGLEVLSHVAVTAPNTLRVFAARPSMLRLLAGDLGLFGLFRSIPYPIDARKLSFVLKLASASLEDSPDPIPVLHPQWLPLAAQRLSSGISHVVLEDAQVPTMETPVIPAEAAGLIPSKPPRGDPASGGFAVAPGVVSTPAAHGFAARAFEDLDASDDTAELPALLPRAETPVRQMTDCVSRPAVPARTPAQMAVFERALARRKAEKIEALNRPRPPGSASAYSRGDARRVFEAVYVDDEQRPGSRGDGVIRASVQGSVKTQLAQRLSKRTAILIGSGLIAATCLVLAFALNAGHSTARSPADAARSDSARAAGTVLPNTFATPVNATAAGLGAAQKVPSSNTPAGATEPPSARSLAMRPE